MISLKTLAEGAGKGLAAGLAGTAAMTLSSTVEAKLRGRPFSTAPAKAATKALGIETFDDGAAYARFSNLVHWGYGTGWGALRGLLRSAGIPSRVTTPLHFATLWGSALYTLPKYEVAPPVIEWEAKEIGIDVFHHVVYVTAAAVAYELLDR